MKGNRGVSSLAARIDIETGLEPISDNIAFAPVLPLASVDMMKLMEAKIEKSEHEAKDAVRALSDIQSQVSQLKTSCL